MVVNSTFHSIMEDNCYLDNVYAYDKKWSIKESVSFARNIAKNNYDLGLNIHGNWRTALLLRLIEPQFTVGYGGKGRGFFLDKEIPHAEDCKHMVDSYLTFLRELDLEVEDGLPQLDISAEANDSILEKLAKWGISPEERIIALNTGGTWPTKRWPIEGFAELADRLNNDYGRVVFLGSKTDLTRVDEIISQMHTTPVKATGKTSLKELAALLKLCKLVISNDSGPVHVAAAVGTPTITIFGPSDDRKYRPLGGKHQIVTTDIDCRPCGEKECPLGHHKCMKDIGVDDITNVIQVMGCFE